MLGYKAILAATLLAGCPLLLAGTADISVIDPYARAVPPGQPNSAAFMSLSNSASEARALVDAHSSAADVVELHTHINEDGMMRMRRVDRIDIPAGERIVLKPGGLHIMLIGLKQDLAPGDALDLTLVYDNGARQSIEIPVRELDMNQINNEK